MSATVRINSRQATVDDGRWFGDRLLCDVAAALTAGFEVTGDMPDPDYERARAVVARLGGEVSDPEPAGVPPPGIP